MSLKHDPSLAETVLYSQMLLKPAATLLWDKVHNSIHHPFEVQKVHIRVLLRVGSSSLLDAMMPFSIFISNFNNVMVESWQSWMTTTFLGLKLKCLMLIMLWVGLEVHPSNSKCYIDQQFMMSLGSITEEAYPIEISWMHLVVLSMAYWCEIFLSDHKISSRSIFSDYYSKYRRGMIKLQHWLTLPIGLTLTTTQQILWLLVLVCRQHMGDYWL